MNEEQLDQLADILVAKVLEKLDARQSEALAGADDWPDYDELGGTDATTPPLVVASVPDSPTTFVAGQPLPKTAFQGAAHVVDPGAKYETEFVAQLRAQGIDQSRPPDHVADMRRTFGSVD